MREITADSMDFRAFQATPGLSAIVRPDLPACTISAISDDFRAFWDRKEEDIVGKSYLALLGESGDPGQVANLMASFAYVQTHKKSHETALKITSIRDGKGKTRIIHWKIKNVPLRNADGEVEFIIHSATDITERLAAQDKAESVRGIEKAYQFFMQAPVIIGFLRGDNYQIELANEGLLRVWKRTEAVIGKLLFEEFPELEKQGIRKLLDEVRHTGKPFCAYEFPLTFQVNGKVETLYFDFIYHAFYENEGENVAAGIISVGHDVTEKVLAKQKFRNVIEQTHNPILILKGEDMILEAANEAMFRVWKTDESVLGKSLPEIRPSVKKHGLMEKLLNVYRTGQPYHGFGLPVTVDEKDTDNGTIYFNFTYQPYREPNGEIVGVMVLASNATEEVIARKKLEDSQRRWRQLADTVPAIVWTADPSGSINFFNRQWYEMTGRTEDESLGAAWTTVLHPDDVGRTMKIWNEALIRQKFYQVEARYRREDGSYRWVIARGVPIKEEGKVVAWYGTSADIDEHKRLELHLEDKVRERTAELAAKNKLLDNILKYSSNGISVSEMIYDDAGNVIDAMTILANDAAVEFAGIPREMYLSKKATEMDPNLLSSPYGQACIKTLRTGEPSIMQYFLEFSGRWLELTVSRMDDSHLIHIFTDVTPIKNAQLELEKSLENLQFANSNLEEFAYAASHDLKEPVRKIQFFSSRLAEGLRDKMDEQSAGLFRRLQKAAGRMEKLIDDLLEYSYAAKGSSMVAQVDVGAKVQGVLEDLELEIQKKQAQIELHNLPVIEGNTRQIQQLFQNLISNALKYSKAEEPPRITITSRPVQGRDVLPDPAPEIRDRAYHLLEVSDNGIGFRSDDAERIFNLFTRLHGDVDSRGSGVGLSIAKKVVENHGGYIWAESDVGKGSTFRILLPATG